MTITLLLLAMHQDIQVRCVFFFVFLHIVFKCELHLKYNNSNFKDHAREELYGIFGASDRDATMEDLNAMRYLDAVIKESLRLYPSVPGFTRELETTLQLSKYLPYLK